MSEYDFRGAPGAPAIEDLFEHGTISENEYKHMTEKIAEKTSRYSPLKKAR